MAMPGVGDEDVELAVLLDERVDRRLGRLRVGDVEAGDLGLAPLGLDRVGDLARGGLALDVVDDDGRPLLGERLAARAADAARAARDQRDLPVESEHGGRYCHASAAARSSATVTHRAAHGATRSRGQARNASTWSSDAASPTLRTRRSFAMRFTSPARTLPGPISSACVDARARP